MFSEQVAQRFPSSRPKDHAITLKLDAPQTMNCKVYQQTKNKLKATQEFINENLQKGYITESKSPYALPLFYQTKANGKLRPIIDYQILNSWTIRDIYPLPLIGSIIDHLQGKTLFSKLNLHWGFNNVRIKTGDHWKGAFKTPYGLYEPAIRFFGLTNSPATFCQAMERMFCQLVQKYPMELFVYVDNILIATTNDVK